MAFTIIGSHTSPFVRKIRLLLFQDKTTLFKPLNYMEEEGDKKLRELSPFNQLPVLFDGEQPIYESRIMFYHIAKKMKLAPLSLNDENILSAIDAALSSAVNLFLLEKSGINISSENYYFIKRQKNRIPTLINFLTPWANKMNPETDWNFLTMSLYSMLSWMEFRKVYDLGKHPEMLSFLERFKNSPGVKETEIPNT